MTHEEEMQKPLTAIEQLRLHVNHDFHAPCLVEVADEVDQLQDQFRHLLQAQEWKPIESAPKDGERIILWLDDEGFSMTGYWDAKEEMWRLPEWDMWTGEEGMHTLTHWMPLPLPPQANP